MPGLISDHKSHMSHVHTGHRNSARMPLNGRISMIMHQELYMRIFLFSNLQCLSMSILKWISDMSSWRWRSHPIAEYWTNICCSQGQSARNNANKHVKVLKERRHHSYGLMCKRESHMVYEYARSPPQARTECPEQAWQCPHEAFFETMVYALAALITSAIHSAHYPQ